MLRSCSYLILDGSLKDKHLGGKYLDICWLFDSIINDKDVISILNNKSWICFFLGTEYKEILILCFVYGLDYILRKFEL